MNDTVFFRAKKTNNYTVIDNGYVRNEKLSWKARGVLTYMLSLPDDWKIRLSDLETRAPDGRESLNTAVKELQRFGYLRKMQTRSTNGLFGETIFQVIEIPQAEKPLTEKPLTEKPLTEKPLTEKPLTGKPSTENPQLLSTNNTKYLDNQVLNLQNTDYTNPARQAAPCEPKKQFVKPTVEEVRAYCVERNNNVDPEEFFDFYESKGWLVGRSKMKDWKASVRTWERMRKNGTIGNGGGNGYKTPPMEYDVATRAEIEERRRRMTIL